MTLRDRKCSVSVHVQVNEKISNVHFDILTTEFSILPLDYTQLHSAIGS